MITSRSALKLELFANASRKRKLDTQGDPLQVIVERIGFLHLAGLMDALSRAAMIAKAGERAIHGAMARILALYCSRFSCKACRMQLSPAWPTTSSSRLVWPTLAIARTKRAPACCCHAKDGMGLRIFVRCPAPQVLAAGCTHGGL